MKKRDLIGLLIIIAIVSVIGILLYTQLAPAPKDSQVKVLIPAKVEKPLAEEADKQKLDDLRQLQDYSKPPKCADNEDTCKATN